MSLLVPCPTCGERPYTEFVFGGELRDISAPDEASDFARVYLRENTAAVQQERWFHELGCHRWVTVRRDTSANRVER